MEIEQFDGIHFGEGRTVWNFTELEECNRVSMQQTSPAVTSSWLSTRTTFPLIIFCDYFKRWFKWHFLPSNISLQWCTIKNQLTNNVALVICMGRLSNETKGPHWEIHVFCISQLLFNFCSCLWRCVGGIKSLFTHSSHPQVDFCVSGAMLTSSFCVFHEVLYREELILGIMYR